MGIKLAEQLDKHAETVELVPSFESAVRMCILALHRATPEGQRIAENELIRYGRMLDDINRGRQS